MDSRQTMWFNIDLICKYIFMKRFYLPYIIGAVLLAGAGCDADLSAKQGVSDTKVEASATAETATESAQENKKEEKNKEEKKTDPVVSGSAAIGRPSGAQSAPAKTTPTPKSATVSAEVTVEAEATVGGDDEAESDQDMIDIFEFKPTHVRNYDAYKLWNRYATRLARDFVEATPAAEIKYKPDFDAALWEGDDEWCPLNQPCKTARDAQMTAYFAMIKADKAFKAKQTNTELLVSAAVSSVSKYFQAILAFEAAWGVKGE